MTAARTALRLLLLATGVVLAVVARMRRSPAPGAPAAARGAVVLEEPAPEPPGRGTQAVRGALIAIGVGGLGFGAWCLGTTVSTKGLVGLAIWLAAAVVLHDAILSPAVFVVVRVMRRLGRRLPGAVLGLVQAAVVVGGVLTLIAAPEIKAKALGPRNPSVLPFDYGLRLALVWAAVAVVTVVAALVVSRVRSRTRPA